MQTAVVVGLAVVGALVPWLACWLVLRLALGSVSRRFPRVRNYRGAEISAGLVLAWATVALLILVGLWPRMGGLDSLVVVPALAAAAVFGTLDDFYGGAEHRGFRGHFQALAHGKVTTGLLKVLGVGAGALVTGYWSAWWAFTLAGQSTSIAALTPRALLVAASVALTANLVNLVDLRPGRALKGYALLAAVAVVAGAVVTLRSEGPGLAVVVAAASLVQLLGPALACWPYDLGEKAMLGDGGANAAGAVAGWLLAVTLPGPALIAWVVAALALNLASERVSFSAVIDRTPPMRWLDMLGRLPLEDARDSAADAR